MHWFVFSLALELWFTCFLVPGHLEWLHCLISPSAAALHPSRTWPSSSALTGFLCKDCLVFTVAFQALPPCRIPWRGESSRGDWGMTGSPVWHWWRSSGQWLEVAMWSQVLAGRQSCSLCRMWCFPCRILSAPGAILELFYYICILSICDRMIRMIKHLSHLSLNPIARCRFALLPQAQGKILYSGKAFPGN